MCNMLCRELCAVEWGFDVHPLSPRLVLFAGCKRVRWLRCWRVRVVGCSHELYQLLSWHVHGSYWSLELRVVCSWHCFSGFVGLLHRMSS